VLTLVCVLCVLLLAVQGKSTGFYGKGAYFANSAGYSHESFVHTRGGVNTLILARVNTGKAHDDKTEIVRQRVKPPPGYNSVKGGPHKFGRGHYATIMYVVYDLSQVYPAFMVDYTINPSVPTPA